MHILKLSIIFATLGQLATEILVILWVYPFIFFLYSNVYINFHEYATERNRANITAEIKDCVIAIRWHHVCYLRAISC